VLGCLETDQMLPDDVSYSREVLSEHKSAAAFGEAACVELMAGGAQENALACLQHGFLVMRA
jgi:hypothetical protein